MKNKSYYRIKYLDCWCKCLVEAINMESENLGMDIGLEANEHFEEICNTDEVVGYYIDFHGDDAYKVWKSNTDGIELSKQDLEIEKILKELYKNE